MKSWSRRSDIRSRLEKKWDKGVFLSMMVSEKPFGPLKIPLAHPGPSELSGRFDAAREWISHWNRISNARDKNRFTLEWREAVHRTLGRNRVPVAVTFNRLEDIISFLGKQKETGQFVTLFQQITDAFPELSPLLIQKPMTVLSHKEEWPQFLSVLFFMKKNPSPGIYIRQMDIPGVDTKFVERHKGWLGQMLSFLLPISERERGKEPPGSPLTFEERYGFRSKPVRIRFRILDPACYLQGTSDIEIPVGEFKHLKLDVETIFIVENETNGLAFPFHPRSMIIFGLGYGLKALSDVSWMLHKRIWYWGDIDTHGFSMLDQIRRYFPDVRSFLMDEETLLDHRTLWGIESTPACRNLTRLTHDEHRMYQGIVSHRHAPNIRLEQEHIHFSRLIRYLKHITQLAEV